jgi:hypothetical protein
MGVAMLASEDRREWTGKAKSALLQELLEVRERLDAEILRTAGDWDRDRAWEIDGALSPRVWPAHRTPLSESEAGRLVKNARVVSGHGEIAEALADGDITTPHVESIGRVMSSARLPLLAEHAETIVEQAKNLPIGDFTTVMRRWASLADDYLSKDTHEEKWDRRHLHASVGLDGWVQGDFFLDPIAGAALIGALDHEAPPDPEDAPDAPRTLSQRRADALVDIVNRHVNGGVPGGNPPVVVAVADVAELVGMSPELAAAQCEIEGIGPVGRSALDQMCCDARFTRFIMAGKSQILDMGRSARVATPAQRRALAVRDRHCRFPSCGRKPQWCDAHHIAGWVESLGETNIDNLILLCRRHHTLLHNSRWTIERVASGEFEFTHPARGP